SISQKRVQSYYIFPPPPNIFANIFSSQSTYSCKSVDNNHLPHLNFSIKNRQAKRSIFTGHYFQPSTPLFI
ncbi:MAG: hypothetical protein K2J12_09745, partial [Muribaculaceae bacterium]|nr:hypothetical protein [Muribaculaceae bacterium]